MLCKLHSTRSTFLQPSTGNDEVSDPGHGRPARPHDRRRRLRSVIVICDDWLQTRMDFLYVALTRARIGATVFRVVSGTKG